MVGRDIYITMLNNLIGDNVYFITCCLTLAIFCTIMSAYGFVAQLVRAHA